MGRSDLRRYPVASSKDARLPLLATGGAVYGLGLARYLFEFDPAHLVVLGTWPGALGAAALAAVTALVVYRLLARRRAGEPSRWAGLALWLPLIAVLAPDVNPLRTLTLLIGSVILAGLLTIGDAPPRPLDESPARRTASPGVRHEARRNRDRPGVPRLPEPAPFESRANGWRLVSSLLPLLLSLCLFSFYVSGLAPAVGEADTFEFQVGIARLGIAHGSGYPLLMLAGRLFASLPVGGTLAFRANLTSAFFGALAGVGAERLARRLGAGPVAALLAGLAFGASPTLWSRAVEVEAYTLNAAMVAGLLLLCLRLASAGEAALRTVRRELALLALLFGLSLTNHLTTLLLAPAASLAALVGLRRLAQSEAGSRAARRTLAGMALLLALGLSVYAYVPLRWPAVNNGEVMRLEQFANLLAGNEARGAFQWALPLRDPGRYAIAFDKIVSEFGWAGPGLALAGLAGLAARRKSWVHLALILLAYAPYLYFALAFNVPDPDFSAFFIPLHLLAAALMGAGAQAVIAAARPRSRRESGRQARLGGLVRIHRERLALSGGRSVEVLVTPPPAAPGAFGAFWRGAVLTAFALLPLASLWRTWPAVDQSGDWAQQRLGELMLAQPLATGAAILADSQKIAPLNYLQVAEGLRPDLDILVLPDEASYRAALEERLAAGQSVYLGRYLPGLSAAYSLRSVGPLAEVSLQPVTRTSVSLIPPAHDLALDGLRLIGYAAPNGLSGAAPESVPLTLAWEAQVTPEANWLVSLRLVDADGEVAWQGAGSVPVGGLYPTNAWRPGEVVTDFHLVPIAHTVTPGQYRLEVGLFAPFAATDDDGWAELGTLRVQPPAEPPTPSHLLRARLGAQWLLGYDLPETAPPGARVPVTLYWLRASTADAVTALGEHRSLAGWPPGALAPLDYEQIAPLDEATLGVTVDTGQPARCGWLAPPSTGCGLPAVRLAGQAAAEGAVNFANLLLLRRATLETARAAPGGQVGVELEWQGLRTLADDYTVFVHLLGPDGQVHGQVDAWPVSGTRATSDWTPGEIVRDPYHVTLPGDAPPGAYQVEIGLYLLATGQRLPVLNAAGAPIDDRVLVPGLSVDRP